MTIEAEAKEVISTETSGSDHDDGAINNQADFDSAFDTESGTTVTEDKPKADVKVPEEKEVEKDSTQVEEKVLTASEKLELAAKEIKEDEPKAETKAQEQSGDFLDLLPPKYAWARNERSSGKLGEWIKQQPKSIQKLAYSGDVEDASYVLDLYSNAQQSSTAPTKAEVKSLLSEYGSVKFTAPDGKEKTLKEIAAEYGNEELFEAFAAMNKVMLGNKQEAPKETRNEVVDSMQQTIQKMRDEQNFWEPILDVHSDGRKLARSGKLQEWVDANGTDGMKRLMASPNPDHAILVLDAYKEAMAKAASEPITEKAGIKKKQIDNLHGESLRPKRENKTLSKPKEESESAFDEGFEAGMKKK